MMQDSNALDSTRLQRLQQTPLWDFALALYAKPGVEGACLTLQEDAGLDVCELLLHCWLYACGLEAVPAALARQREQRRRWQREVTAVLRGLRRNLKASAVASQSITALRETIKQAELMAERENLQRWQAWVIAAPMHEQRVANIAEKSINTAQWLRKQLLMAEIGFKPTASEASHLALLKALQTITCQLDP